MKGAKLGSIGSVSSKKSTCLSLEKAMQEIVEQPNQAKSNVRFRIRIAVKWDFPRFVIGIEICA
jgi:hypothetical protein